MSSHELEQPLHQYGLALVFAVVALQALGLPLPGTTALSAERRGAAGAAWGEGPAVPHDLTRRQPRRVKAAVVVYCEL